MYKGSQFHYSEQFQDLFFPNKKGSLKKKSNK